jgi:hypothetical protein
MLFKRSSEYPTWLLIGKRGQGSLQYLDILANRFDESSWREGEAIQCDRMTDEIWRDEELRRESHISIEGLEFDRRSQSSNLPSSISSLRIP